MPPKPRHPFPTPPCRVCLACHGPRLATLLETASTFCCFALGTDGVAALVSWPMPPGGLPALATLLAAADVGHLVCGGATCCCLAPFARRGITVSAWINGDVTDVLAAIAHNRLDALLAPGARPGRIASGPGRPGRPGRRDNLTELLRHE